MKILIVFLSIFFLNIANAEVGTIESYYSPSLNHDDDDQKIVHIFLQNNCYQEVFVATRSENPNGVWETKGYTRLFPGQIVFNGDMINSIYYLNAFTADYSVRWEGEHRFEIQGRTVKALLVELPKDYSGNWTTVLYCR
jgi:hypothetical protein